MTSPSSVPLNAGVRPRRLREGDVVALIAPSGPVSLEQLEAGTAILQSWGLQVREMPHVRDVHPEHDYLAGADEGAPTTSQRRGRHPMFGRSCACGEGTERTG